MSIEISLANQVALVTGASRGIGHAIAQLLGRAGAYVYGTATTEAGAEKITAMFKETSLMGEGLVLKVQETDSIDAMLAKMKASKGMPGILVNNAAITRDNLVMRMKDDEWLAVLETNLTSLYRLSKACIRDMLKAKTGRIINIGSVVGSTGNPGQVNYCAAKAGVVGFSKALALEVGSRHITVNTVSPGFIETDMTRVLTDDQRETIFRGIPMNKMGTVDDIAMAVLYLASPGAGYITGQTLHVNGGMFMN